MNKKFSILMFAAMALWAGSWISGKLISGSSSNSQFVFWRFAITAITYLFIYIHSLRTNRIPSGLMTFFKTPALFPFVFLAAAALTGYNLLFIFGLTAGLAGKGGVIVTTLNPLIGFIIGTLLYKNKFSSRSWKGIVLGLAGGIILVEPWKYSLQELIDGGNLIFVAAAFCWAILTALGQRLQKTLSLWEFNLLTYLLAFIMTIPLIWNRDIFDWQQYTAGFWINTVYLAIIAGTIAGGIYFYASKLIGSARAGTFTFMVPGMALIYSYLFLHEIPEITTIAGGTLAVSAVYIINRSK